MKQKLLIMTVALLCSVGMWAQTWEDVTNTYITNPSFESNGSVVNLTNDNKATAITGWVVDGIDSNANYNPDLGLRAKETEAYNLSNSEGSYIFYVLGWWQGNPTVKQTISSLPAGAYKLTATIASDTDKDVRLYAGDNYVESKGKGTKVGMEKELFFVTTAVTNIEIGAKNTNWGWNRLEVDKFKLYKATSTNNIDITSFYVVNPKASTDLSGWETTGSIARKGDANGFDGAAGFFEFCNWNASSWSGSMTQTISDLPTGLYKVRAAGQQSTSDTELQMVIDDGTPINFDNNGDTNGTINSSGAEVAVGSGVAGWRYKTSPNIYINDGSMKIEFKSKATAQHRWANIDNVELYYLGQAVKDVAVALPGNGAMAAETWYYQDVTTTGIHAFAASNLSNIVYTTTANDLESEVSATLPQNFLNSSSTRYYFKSSSDQTLTISKICDNFSYWFLRTSDYKYLSRGGQYNAQAVADEYGLPVRIAFENNYVNFIFVDNWRYLFDAADGKLFEDTDATTYVNFAIQPTDGGYYIINKNDRGTLNQKLYIYTNDGNRVKMSSENATVWVLESVSGETHKTRMQTIKDAQATLAATSAGVTWTDTQDELDAYLSNVTFENKTITTSGQKEAYQKDAANNGPWTVFSETVSGLSDGLYKVSVKAFERIASNDDTYDKAAGNAGLAYLYANDQKVQLCSVFDYPSDVAYTDNGENPSENVTKGGKYYPNSMYGAQQAFDAGKYINEVFVWVTGGSVEFGIRIPQSYQNNTNDNTRQNWICCNDYSLTYYGDARINISEESSSAPSVCDNANVRLTRTLTGGQWNGFSLPFSLSAEQLEASSLNGATIKQWASVSENVITLEDATEIVAGDPYLIKPTANDNANIVNPTFNNVTVTNPTEAVKGEGSYTLQAHLYATDLATDGSVAYVSTTDSSIKKLTSGGINGLRAIFKIPTATSVKALTVNFGDDTTGILSVDGNITESGAIYNLAGQRLSKAQKGVNIINGKKVLIK